MFNISRDKAPHKDLAVDEAPVAPINEGTTRSINGIDLRHISIDMLQEDGSDVNPRLGENEAKNEMKNGIHSTLGRDIILEVSQRPGETNYCLHRGGNTRLQVLRELRNEWSSEDPNPYERVSCLVFPWVGEHEKSIITATENTARGSLSFAEKSRAVVILAEKFDELDLGKDGLSFVDWAKGRGVSMTLSTDLVTRYVNTNNLITPNMPRLMIEGRANQRVVIGLLKVRSMVYRVFRNRDEAGARAEEDLAREEALRLTDEVVTSVYRQCDGLNFDKKKLYSKTVEEIVAVTEFISPEERSLFVAEEGEHLTKFSTRYGLSKDMAFSEDKKRNAAILLMDALSPEKKLSAHSRTKAMNRMNVTPNVEGFVQLASHLDGPGKNMLCRIIKES